MTTKFIDGSLPFHIRVVEEALQDSGVKITKSCCSVEEKYCSNDEFKGYIRSLIQSAIVRYVEWQLQQHEVVTFLRCPICDSLCTQDAVHQSDKTGRACTGSIGGINLAKRRMSRISRPNRDDIETCEVPVSRTLKSMEESMKATSATMDEIAGQKVNKEE